MKKILAAFVFAMVLSLAGCSEASQVYDWAESIEGAGKVGYEKCMEAMEIYLEKMEQEAEESSEEVIEEKIAANADNLPYDIASLETANETTQIVLVVGGGSLTGTNVYMFEQDDDLVWQMLHSTAGFWGKNGISYHTIEGDMTTPAGVFDLGVAFGINPNPGTQMPWFDVNEYQYWVDDVNSEYYNQLIDSREVPLGWSSGEHLIEYKGSYNYCVNIEVNPECIRPDSTSAIFLHCGGWPTLGCVSVPEDSMVTILKRIKPGAKIIIAEDDSKVQNY